MAGDEVRMMMSVYPGAMTGFAALQSGLVSINNVFMSMTRAMDAQFGLIDTAIITTGAVVTQLGIDAMNAFGQFEQSMKIVQMVSGQTKQEIEQLGQAANQFSVEYRMDIDQITEGLQTLGRAGLNSATEQAEVLKNGLNTAKLEGRDLNSVLQELIQNTALLGGDLKSSNFGEQSQYVNDLLVATSMTAPITTHDVSETLKYSGGIAAAAGANIETDEGKAILEDYMASIAAFAQKGVTGSIAGTALRAFFNKPATQDSSVVDALASIKLKPEYLWEDDEETMKPVSEQIALIKGQMDKLGVSTMDRLQIWSKIVGGKMGQQMMKLDSDDIKELKKDIQAADDSTSLATRSMQTYQANVKELGEAGALLQRNVGGHLVQIVNPFLDLITKVTEFLNNDFLSWPLAAGIIAFIGMAGKKAMSVISALKAEISTLFRGMQTFYTQKQGWVAGNPPPFDKDYGKWGKQGSSEKSQKVEKTSKEIGKQTAEQFAKSYGKTSAPTVAELRKQGLNDMEIAMRGRFAKLTKDSTGLGISDARFAEIMSRGVLPKHELDAIGAKISGTNAARDPFDSTFLKDNKFDPRFIPYIQKNAQAMQELGPALQKMGYITTTNVIGAKQYTEAMQNTFGSTKNAGSALDYMSKSAKNFTAYQNAMQNSFGSLRNAGGALDYMSKSAKNFTLYQNAMQGTFGSLRNVSGALEFVNTSAKKYAAEVVEIEKAKQTEILTTTQVGAAKVVESIQLAVNQASLISKSINSRFMPSYINPSSYLGLGTGFGSTSLTGVIGLVGKYGALGDFHPGILYGGIAGSANAAADALLTQKILGNLGIPLSPQDVYPNKPYYTPPFKSQSITGGGQPPIPVGYTYGPNQLLLLPEAEVTKHPPTPNSAGVGTIPTIQDNLKREQNVKQLHYENLGKQAKAGQNAVQQLQTHQEQQNKIASQQQEQNNRTATNIENLGAQARNASIALEQLQKKAVAQAWNPTEEARKRKESADVLTRKEGKETAKRLGVQKADTNAREEEKKLNKIRRDVSTERDRAKFRNESSNLITSRKEISKIQDEAKKSYDSLKAINNTVPAKYTNQLNYLEKQNSSLAREAIGESILKQNRDVLNRVQNNPIIMQNYAGNMGAAGGTSVSNEGRFGSAFYANFTDKIGRAHV